MLNGIYIGEHFLWLPKQSVLGIHCYICCIVCNMFCHDDGVLINNEMIVCIIEEHIFSIARLNPITAKENVK